MIGKAVYFSHSHRVRLVFEPDGTAYMDVDHLTPGEEVERMVMHANLRGYEPDYVNRQVDTHRRFLRHHMTTIDGSKPAPFKDLFTLTACAPDCPTCSRVPS